MPWVFVGRLKETRLIRGWPMCQLIMRVNSMLWLFRGCWDGEAVAIDIIVVSVCLPWCAGTPKNFKFKDPNMKFTVSGLEMNTESRLRTSSTATGHYYPPSPIYWNYRDLTLEITVISVIFVGLGWTYAYTPPDSRSIGGKVNVGHRNGVSPPMFAFVVAPLLRILYANDTLVLIHNFVHAPRPEGLRL